MSLKSEPVAVRIEGVELAKIFDSRFLGQLAKEIPAPLVWYLHLRAGKPKKDGGPGAEDISISASDESEGIPPGVIVAAERTETMKGLVRAFEAVAK